MIHDTAAFPGSAAELLGTRTGSARERHEAAVARTLGWADEAAARHDYTDALAWLTTLEAIGETLPDHYLCKREAWERCARFKTGEAVA